MMVHVCSVPQTHNISWNVHMPSWRRQGDKIDLKILWMMIVWGEMVHKEPCACPGGAHSIFISAISLEF